MNRSAATVRKFGALLALPLLSGCIAAAALPMMAGGAMFAGGNVKIRAATPRSGHSGTVRVVPGKVERTAGAAMSALPAPLTQPPGQGATAIPQIAAAAAPGTAIPGPWQQFFEFVQSSTDAAEGRTPGRSALLETGTSLALPAMRPCQGKPLGVIIDLDADRGVFAPGEPHTPLPGLAEGVAKLRSAGVIVLWISALPAGDVGPVAEALRSSGLDPEGKDPLLLARSPGDRKQVLREEANNDVCVIAIAGDRKGDFDELFDYLRDPHSGDSLDFLLGEGWFLVPPPLG